MSSDYLKISFFNFNAIIKIFQIKFIVERCNRVNVTDAFFDACVFDFLISNDEMFVAQIAAAQYDIIDLYAPYIRHYFTGRKNLTLYDSKAGYRWKQCIRELSGNSGQISGSTTQQQQQQRQYNIIKLVIFMQISIMLTCEIS